jgi:hypothetical protein
LTHAMTMRGPDPQMEFAAALIAASYQNQREVARLHLQKAAAGATEGSLLAKNLLTHCHIVGLQANRLAELRSHFVAAKN